MSSNIVVLYTPFTTAAFNDLPHCILLHPLPAHWFIIIFILAGARHDQDDSLVGWMQFWDGSACLVGGSTIGFATPAAGPATERMKCATRLHLQKCHPDKIGGGLVHLFALSGSVCIHWSVKQCTVNTLVCVCSKSWASATCPQRDVCEQRRVKGVTGRHALKSTGDASCVCECVWGALMRVRADTGVRCHQFWCVTG